MNENRNKLLAVFDKCRNEALWLYDRHAAVTQEEEPKPEVPTEDTPMGTSVVYFDALDDTRCEGTFVCMTYDASSDYNFTVLPNGLKRLDPNGHVFRYCEIITPTKD